MPYAFTMKLDAKYVKTSFENEEVWQQVEQEWKGRRWPISYSFGHPIDVEALGDVRVQITSAHKTLPPMFPAKFRDAVSQTIRDYIETVDAGIHQFIPMNVTLKSGVQPTDTLNKELVQWVGKEIGPIAKPDVIQFAPGLPKTRSGKIMRRILRKIAEGDTSNLGDTTTLADPSVVTDLVKNGPKK